MYSNLNPLWGSHWSKHSYARCGTYLLQQRERQKHSLAVASNRGWRMNSDGVIQLRTFGLVGVAGSVLLLLSDWVMLAAPTSGQEFGVRWLDILSTMPQWRLTVGGLAGPIGACLYAAGFWHVYLGLRPANRLVSFACFATQSSSFVTLAAFHAAFPFAAHLQTINHAAGDNPTVRDSYSAAMEYLGNMYYVGLALGLIRALLLIGLLLVGQTRYPRWFVLVNPSFLWFACFAFRYVPAPLGGALFIGSGNIAHLTFFVLSTIVLWHRGGECKPAR